MERQNKIIDASVIVKWFSDEKDSDKALQIRDDHLASDVKIIVPELLFIEVLNALRWKNKDNKTLDFVNQALWDTQFQVEKLTPQILEKANFLSIKYGLSMYDSIYLALSVMYSCPLITADEKLGKIDNAVVL